MLEPLRTYLTQVREACRDDRETLKEVAPDSLTVLNRIDLDAEELQRGFVLRYGIVGDSNAGKSRLIGGLLGMATALPVESIPCTGNITILRVRHDASRTSTGFAGHRLRYFSAADAASCAAFLFNQLVEGQRAANVSGPRIDAAELRSPAGQAFPLASLLAWVRSHWTSLSAQGDAVRNRLKELARFALVWDRVGSLLCGIRERDEHVSELAALAAMKLPTTSTVTNFSAFEAEVVGPLAGVRIPSEPTPELAPWLTPEVAAACYPLVREIGIEIGMPSSVWDLRELHLEAIELFDFPGLAAPETTARDLFLSEIERNHRRIHTWVVLVNSSELRGTQAHRIIPQLPSERVVVVASRFDELPLRPEGVIDTLKQLVALEEPCGESKALTQLRLLTPLTTIFALTTANRCVFLSSLIGQMEIHAVTPILTEAQVKNWQTDHAEGEAAQRLWGALAAKIRQTEPGSTLARWLSDYSQPNGQGGSGTCGKSLWTTPTRWVFTNWPRSSRNPNACRNCTRPSRGSWRKGTSRPTRRGRPPRN